VGGKQQIVVDKLHREAELQRKNNISIFRFEEDEYESYFDKTEAVANFF
jgi:hypothetical protein